MVEILDRYITENIGNFSSKCFKVTYIRCFSRMLLKAAVLQNILKQEMSLKKTNGVRLKKEENITQG